MIEKGLMDSQIFDPWSVGGLPLLNIAATCHATRALGPGLRAVVWVQGCPFQCLGCIAPEWTLFRPAHLIRPEELVEKLPISNIDGLTFSGGEPMLQAAGLTKLIRLARMKKPELSLICYTGFRLEQIYKSLPGPGVRELLGETDVLIDGVYVAALNDERGLRGSSNQHIHFLTERLKGEDFERYPRRLEIHVDDRHVLLVGIPTLVTLTKAQSAIEKAVKKQTRGQEQ